MKTITSMIALVAASASVMACNNNNKKAENMTAERMEQMVVEELKAIETGAQEPVAYINAESYTQHNLGVADGLAGFGAALAQLANYPEKARVNTVRVFADGDYVVAHTDYNFFGPKIGFDIFRFEDGKIVEHWDNLQTTPESANPSGHTMVDGTTEIADVEKTEENKQIAENFVKDVLMGQHPEKLTEYFDGNNYIQHNPGIADGLDGLGAALANMAEAGIEMKYDTLHKVLGKGNFVLTVSEGYLGGVHTSYYDLFRIENGKIAEHWDVIESILPEGQRANGNGKFGFVK